MTPYASCESCFALPQPASAFVSEDFGSSVPVSIYGAIACAISGVSALLARETKGVELSEIR